MHKFLFDIDLSGACNLRCPSCPQGNVRDYRLPHGFMAPDLLQRILAKAKSECRVGPVNLYNWTEPLLHPRVTELVRMVKEAGIPCNLSSNLNLLPDADAIMLANPDSFRISTSGFSQEMYARTHRGGDIARVKKHMVALAEAKNRQQATTNIHVLYHRYRHNLQEEPLMREFATGLGFAFQTVWALTLPLEKILAQAGEPVDDFILTEEDRQFLDLLAVPLDKALLVAQKYARRPCPLRDDAITLDFQGNVLLCCAVFNARKYSLGHYLDLPLAEIQRLRNSHPLCACCMRRGAHVYMTFGIQEMDELALANINPEDAELLDLRAEFARKRQRQRLRNWTNFLSAGQKAALVGCFSRMQRFLRRS